MLSDVKESRRYGIPSPDCSNYSLGGNRSIYVEHTPRTIPPEKTIKLNEHQPSVVNKHTWASAKSEVR